MSFHSNSSFSACQLCGCAEMPSFSIAAPISAFSIQVASAYPPLAKLYFFDK